MPKQPFLTILFLAVLHTGCTSDVEDHAKLDAPMNAANDALSPVHWKPGVEQAYFDQLALGASLADTLEDVGVNLTTRGDTGIVASTSNGLAVHAGLNALKLGGSAIDAALTTALSQVVLHAGGATSFAGQFFLVYFDAESRQVSSLSSGYATVLGEAEPLSIPPYGQPSGRGVLTPGFMAGVSEAHRRFGRLNWESLFQPALHFAENGFPVSPKLHELMQARSHSLLRLPSGRAIFLDDQGDLPGAGELFRQPQLAGFLKKVSKQGAEYMYDGYWAEAFVAGVQELGGKITIEDMKAYKPQWSTPLSATIAGNEVYGGGGLLEVLRLAQLSGIGSGPHYSDDPATLYSLIKISRISQTLGPVFSGESLTQQEVENFLPGIKLDPEQRYTSEMAETIHAYFGSDAWKSLELEAEGRAIKNAEMIARLVQGFGEREIEEDEAGEEGSRPDHTAGIVAIDSEGNMAAVVHSVTSALWGELGLFVEGVSVVDPGAFAQYMIAERKPGEHLLDARDQGICPAIVVRDGAAVAGCGAIGASVDSVSHQGMVNLLLYRMSPDEAAEQPMFRKNWPPGIPLRQPVGDGEFSQEILAAIRELGIDVVPVTDHSQASHGGMFVSAGKDPESGEVRGGVSQSTHSRVTSSLDGLVQAY